MQTRATHVTVLILLITLCAVYVVSAQRIRATEGFTRISIFIKNQPAGGFVVRVKPTDTWNDLLQTAQNRLHLASICSVSDQNGVSIRSLHEVFDESELYFEECAPGYCRRGFEASI